MRCTRSMWNYSYVTGNFQTNDKAWKVFVGSHSECDEEYNNMRNREYLLNRPFTY